MSASPLVCPFNPNLAIRPIRDFVAHVSDNAGMRINREENPVLVQIARELGITLD